MVSNAFLSAVVWGSVLVVAGSTVLAWRQRPRPGATAFAITMLAATWWVTASSLGLFATSESATLFWEKVQWAGVVYLPVAWLAFTLAYTGRGDVLSRRRLGALCVVPTLSLALALTTGLSHDLIYRGATFHGGDVVLIAERSFGPWMWVHVAYSYSLLAVGTALVVQVVTERRLLYRGQALALVLVVAAPWVGSGLYLAGASPVPFFDPTPYTFVISGAAGIAALTQLQFLNAVPVTSRVAHRSVVENVDAGVLVADTDGHVVEANPRARTLLADGGATLIGERVTEHLPPDDWTDGGVVETAGETRTRFLEVRETELTDGNGTVTGRILLVRDVTERRNRVQRLNVLNRVLRHNVRNEMNVVYGQADRLADGDGDPQETAAAIREKAEQLTDLANKARQIDGILDTSADEPTDLARVVEIERDRVESAYEDVAVEVTVPDDALAVDPAAGTVLRNVVENAAEHNTADDPRVCVDVEREGARARVDVTDNGPGIPADELAALAGDAETQLDHASGLGLWLVRWGVTAVGGEIEAADRDPSGSRVTLWFPLVEDERADAADDDGTDEVDAARATGDDAGEFAASTLSDDDSPVADRSGIGDVTPEGSSVSDGSPTTEG
jgi:signal transduction histidine kinase